MFVLWTRLIRPDGVSIEIASPATDDLGRGGIGGKVNRHFLQRFGGAILTTVLSAGVNALTASRSGGSTVFVGSANQAASLAGQAMGNAELKVIAAELVTKARQSVTIDWTVRESARSRIKVMVKRILKKHGYPPDLQDEAVKTVLMQAELLCADWV